MSLLALLPLLLAAVSPDSTGARPAPPLFKFAGDVGYVSTAGNSSVQTLNLGNRLSMKTGDVTLLVAFGAGLTYGSALIRW